MISSEVFLAQVQQYCHPGTTKDEIIEAWMSMLDELPAERLDFIDALRAKGHPVYLLSNGNDLHFDFINRKYGLDRHFDGFFLSQKMHMAKPEPQIFEAVQTAIGNPDSVVFIDDIPSNRQAAEQTVHWQTYESLDALRQAMQ
jgi:HAD superfamily hydrolase (TIGR01509 family)